MGWLLQQRAFITVSVSCQQARPKQEQSHKKKTYKNILKVIDEVSNVRTCTTNTNLVSSLRPSLRFFHNSLDLCAFVIFQNILK